MEVLYVAGPIRNQSHWERHKNILRAEAVAVQLWQKGFAVICPHKNTEFIDGAVSSDAIEQGDLELLGRCDGMVLLVGWSLSAGTRVEVEYALQHNIPIYSWNEDSQELTCISDEMSDSRRVD
jgi:nucleoside 2-deoxyribosyltransferase